MENILKSMHSTSHLSKSKYRPQYPIKQPSPNSIIKKTITQVKKLKVANIHIAVT